MFKGGPREPRPPPLPPETRTIGQLVAESMKLYQQDFWRRSGSVWRSPGSTSRCPIGGAIPVWVLRSVAPRRPDLARLRRWLRVAAGTRPAGATSSSRLGLAPSLPAVPLFAVSLFLPGASVRAGRAVVPAVLKLRLGPRRAPPRASAREGRLPARAGLRWRCSGPLVPDDDGAPFLLRRQAKPRAGRGLPRRPRDLAAALPRHGAALLRPGRPVSGGQPSVPRRPPWRPTSCSRA